MQLCNALKHWNSPDFEQALKAELENLPAGTLPLHGATTQGGIVDDSDIAASILGSVASTNHIKTRVAIFFTEIVAGCNCDDPPLQTNGYSLVQVSIDRNNAAARFELIND